MNSKELRIGNLVQCKVTQHEAIIEMIDSQCSVCSLQDGLCDLHLLEPIPLTKEWLLKLGFEYCQLKTSKRFWLPNFNIRIFNRNSKTKVSYRNITFEHILYVHQLQNLYFALKGEELPIK